jgi:hypothetical protein
MIPTNKSELEHLRIEETSRAWKTDKSSSKKTQKSNELSGESTQRRKLPFTWRLDSLQIEEKSSPMEQGNEKQSKWMVCRKP